MERSKRKIIIWSTAILLTVGLGFGVWKTVGIPKAVVEATGGVVVNGEESAVNSDLRVVANSWEKAPKIGENSTFGWHSYDVPYQSSTGVNLKNKIEAKAKYGDQSEIRFFILNDGKKLINAGLTDFTLSSPDLAVSDEVKEELNSLEIGNYYMVATLKGTDEYGGLNELPDITWKEGEELTAEAQAYVFETAELVSFKIEVLVNRWFQTPAIANWVYGDTPKSLVYEPKPYQGKETYTLTGDSIASTTFHSRTELNEGIKSLGIANACRYYQVELFVPGEANHYTELKEVIKFRVKRQTKIQTYGPSPFNGKEMWVKDFIWGSKYIIDFGTCHPDTPEVDRIVFSVLKRGTEEVVVQQDVLMRDGFSGDKSMALFKANASKIDVGKYTIRGEVFEGETHGGCSAYIDFEVTPASLTGWKTEPSISKNAWGYGESAGVITAVPNNFRRQMPNPDNPGGLVYQEIDLSKDAVVSYYKRTDDDKKGEYCGTQMPSERGKYFAEVGIRETVNYSLPENLVRLVPFEITLAELTSFSTQPYAVGWTWNEFDKTVNLFGAVPSSGGKVSFSVMKNDEVVNGLGKFTVDGQNVVVDPDGTIAEKLNALDAGAYKLLVEVAESTNYSAFHQSTQFIVTKATNRWKINPNVARWSQYYFDAEKNTPQGAALYGDAIIEVKSKQDGKIYYKSVGGVAEIERLDEAMGGWYTFTAVVVTHNNYTALDYSIEFQVFTESADMPNNYWVTVPAIDSWIAGNPAPVPEGRAYRGTLKLSYSKAELVNGKYVAAGDSFEQLPEAPGKYFMRARISHKLYPQDEKLQLDVLFEIFERANEWTVTPSIQSWSLGDGPSEPIADVLHKEDCVIEITYKLKYSDDEPTARIPTSTGTYLMIVRATAKYCTPLEAQVEFTVSLSQNSWVSAPSIKDWSEEFEASNPFGEAAVGNDKIVYSYARADKPEERFTQKPTTEGDYIMYATLAMEGYETLTAEYAFSISPAFDSSLLALDIALGVIAFLTTGVVLYFAIKRYKQN